VSTLDELPDGEVVYVAENDALKYWSEEWPKDISLTQWR
jgi:hypothetical protein